MLRAALCLALLSLPAAALAREVTGTLAYPARIALPPGTEVVVVLTAPDGTRSEARRPAEGEVPLPFALTAPDGAGGSLRAALVANGAALWVSAPTAVPPGDGDVALGPLALARHVPLGFGRVLRCGAQVVELGFAGATARLRVGGRVFDLAQVPAASGARFADAAGTVLHAQGNRALLTLAGVDLPECLPMIAPTLPLTARGNEPGWTLTLAPEGFSLSTEAGGRLDLPLPPATDEGGATRFAAPGVDVLVAATPCRDTMTGLPHPYAVTIERAEGRLSGCGGDPMALLSGAWRLADMAPAPLPDGVVITLEVRGTRVSGQGGCNRYSGALRLTGEGLALGPLAATRMACPAPQMGAEAAWLALLSRVASFDVEEGALLLLSAEGDRLARLIRP